jgi:hypothetical protein
MLMQMAEASRQVPEYSYNEEPKSSKVSAGPHAEEEHAHWRTSLGRVYVRFCKSSLQPRRPSWDDHSEVHYS